MITSIHIIGCGHVGYLISQLIPSIPTINKIYLYDSGCFDNLDVVMGIFPTFDCKHRMNKAISAQLKLLEKYQNIKVEAFTRRIEKIDRNNMSGLIIDCTDTKMKYNLHCDFSVSADGNCAVIDGTDYTTRVGIDSDYSDKSQIKLFKLLAKEVINYINKKAYKSKLKLIFKLTKGRVEYINGYRTQATSSAGTE